jgi:hypothetical protein
MPFVILALLVALAAVVLVVTLYLIVRRWL